jgi:hypothetical protein
MGLFDNLPPSAKRPVPAPAEEEVKVEGEVKAEEPTEPVAKRVKLEPEPGEAEAGAHTRPLLSST